MDPLSRRLNGLYLKVGVKVDEEQYTCNHLLFIDDLKLLAESDEVIKSMVEETKSFFITVGLEMDVEKSATNSKTCEKDARLRISHEGYKYLGITENRDRKNYD
ncbi:hypothetical protein NGRA_2733 [Nosema granulosis]|uniref:Reverse transcriptase domain-containing protein n=1 Tax=Nosema granulosis TaxID=83296 RepID=A0A9P6GWV4_9MICR|nr:hypothetical protein NGRA_2733 [Nosema granulosis]